MPFCSSPRWHRQADRKSVRTPLPGGGGLWLTTVYTGEQIGNVSGGLREGSTYLDNLDVQIEVARGHLFGVPGLAAFVYVLRNNSSEFSGEYVGDIQVVSNIDAPESWRFYELWLDWASPANGLSARLGLYDLNSEFDTTESSDLFMNSSHGINPTFSLTGLNGPSIFPVTSLALRLRGERESGLYWQAAVLDGAPGDPDDPSSDEITLSGDEGAQLVLEAGYGGGAWRKLALGAWMYTAEFDALDDIDASGDAVRDNGNAGLYAIADRMLVSGEVGELTGFLRVGYGNARFNQVEYYVGGGLTLGNFWKRRPADQIGVAFASAINGSDYRDAMSLLGAATDTHETVFEVTYRGPVTDWLTLQPDVQYVVNPGTDPALENSLVVGLRFEVALSRPW